MNIKSLREDIRIVTFNIIRIGVEVNYLYKGEPKAMYLNPTKACVALYEAGIIDEWTDPDMPMVRHNKTWMTYETFANTFAMYKAIAILLAINNEVGTEVERKEYAPIHVLDINSIATTIFNRP